MSKNRAFDDKLTSLGFLACGLAHDIGNFTTAIAVTAQMLKSQHSKDVVTREHCDRILLACRRLGELAHDILNFIKTDSTTTTRFSLNQIVEEAAPLLELLGVSIRIDVEEDLAPIEGNRSLIYVALMNLCINAANALKPSGIVTLRTRNLRRQPRDYVRVTIIDDGIGMPEEVAERAFEPLFTARPDGGGTGMGLAIVRRVIEEHRGEIQLSSVPDQGTVVDVTFPAVDPPLTRLSRHPQRTPT